MPADTRGTSIGIVVTHDTTLAAQVRVRGGRVEVVTWGALATPPESMDGAAIADSSRVATPIRALKRDLNLRERGVAFALLSPGYGMRAIRLPDVPENERRTLVRGELEDAAAIPVGNGAFDMLWVPVRTEDGKRQADVSAYYVSDQTVESTADVVRQGGFELDGIEPASIAMIRAVVTSTTPPRPLAIICPSEKHSDLCVHDGERVRLLRRIPAGWSDLHAAAEEEAAAQRMLGTGDESEYRDKPEPGVPTATGIWSEEGDFPEVVNQPLQRPAAPPAAFAMPEMAPTPALERASPSQFLASEVTRTLAFYSREHPDAARPEALVVLGPGSVVRDFRRALASSVPIPLATTDPLASIDVAKPATSGSAESDSHLLLTAIGVALGAAHVEPSLPQIDVSQQEQAAKGRRRAPVLLLAGMAGSTLWMLGAAVAAITLSFLESNARSENASIMAEIGRVKEEHAALLKASEIGNAAKAAYDKTAVPAAAVLGRVAASSVPGVSVIGVKVNSDGKLSVDGKALNEAAMQEFVVLLTRGSAVRGPVSQTIRIDKGSITFTVSGAFRSEQAAAPRPPNP